MRRSHATRRRAGCPASAEVSARSEFTFVRLDDDEDGVAVLTLRRPERLNALTAPMIREMITAVDQVASGSARALMLTGAGRAFCAGADLVEAAADETGAADRGAILERSLNPLMLRLAALPIPVVTAVNGPAVGGGCGIALAGDIVIAARSASFLLPFTRLGLVPDVGATWLLPRLVGRARALGTMMLGDSISAQQAIDWGLIWAVADDGALREEALAIARRLAAGPTVALGLTRSAVNLAATSSLADALDGERKAQRRAGATEDHREGLVAFLSKDQPRFQGR